MKIISRWRTDSDSEALQCTRKVSNILISCWDSERVYLRRRDTLVASLEHLLMSPVFLESRTSYCIFVGNRCRYHPWSSFCWCWSPGFGACTGPEASCTPPTQYLGSFTAGQGKFLASYQPSTSVQLTLQDERTELFTANRTMRRYSHLCSQRDLWSRWRSSWRTCLPYSKARRVCILCIFITADLSHLMTRSFEGIRVVLINLTNYSFIKRYRRRAEMERDLSDWDSSLRDTLLLFCVSSETFAKTLFYSQHHRFRFKSAYLNKFRKRRNTGWRKPRRSLKRLWVVICHPPPLIRIMMTKIIMGQSILPPHKVVPPHHYHRSLSRSWGSFEPGRTSTTIPFFASM